MKQHKSIVRIFSLACVYLILAGCGTQSGTSAGASPNSGRLLVSRAAKFGYRLNLVLSVDGKDVANLTEGQSYDGYLPPGQHVLGARVTGGAPTGAAQKTVTVQAGQTYSYTAKLSGGHVVLVAKQ
jgi:hypothetical protein